MTLLAPELPGCRWLDLCCGSGVMACEAIQRGADTVVAIEQDRRIAAIAKANLEAVAQGSSGQSHIWVHCNDVERWLAKGAGTSSDSASERHGAFDLIYADPPYAAGLYGAIATGVSRGGWLKPDGLMVWECATTKTPNLPAGWQLADQRRYGSTSLMVLKLDSAVEDGAAPVLVPGRHE
jgi:16S rRNA (guanine(966)-N(2))-methyltransferase RsmD